MTLYGSEVFIQKNESPVKECSYFATSSVFLVLEHVIGRRDLSALQVLVLVAQSCSTLCNPMDYSLPGSSVRRILQARILEWVAMPSIRDLPDSGIEPMSFMSPALKADSLPSQPPGKLLL